MHEQRQTKNKREDVVPKGAVPAYLLDRCATTTVIILFIASGLLRDRFVWMFVSVSVCCDQGRASQEPRCWATWSSRRGKRKLWV